MKTMIVQGKQTAIITKKDTIIFNAQAFEHGNESTVEDILKELPGVTVAPNGQIKVNGKPITKVLIGDEDLFGTNYQLLTKNLTAKAIKSVSVYKHYHENPVLKGVSHSNQTVLNLKLKKSFKVDLFGSLTGYYDLKDHYRAKGNAISITKNFKGYLFENANNAGYDPTGNIYLLLHTNLNRLFSGEPELGSGANSATLIGTSPQHLPHLDRSRYLRNQASFHAFGGIYNPVKKLKLKGVGYFLPSNRQVNRLSLTNYDPELGVPNLMEQRRTHKNIRAGLGKLTAVYTLSDKTNLKYEGNFRTFPENDRTHRTFRNRPLQIRLHNHDRTWNHSLKFTHKTAKTHAYQIRLRYKDESVRQNYRVNPVLAGGPFGSDSILLVQHSKSHLSYAGADFKYWGKDTTGLTWSVRAGGERRGNDLHNHIADQPSFTGGNYWNQYRGFAALTLRKTFFGHLKTHAKVTGNAVRNDANLDSGMDDVLFYASPEIGFNYHFFKKQHIQGQYALNHDLPAFKNLYNSRWLTGYRTILQGSDLFTILPSNIFTFLYQFGNWKNDFVLNSSFVYSTSAKSYTMASTITPTYDFSTYRLEHDRKFLNAGLGLNEFVDFLQSNLAFKYHFSHSAFTSYFNNSANGLRSQTHQFSFAIRTAFVGAFNASGGVDYLLSSTRNQTDQSLRKHQYISGYLNLNFKIGKKFSGTLKDSYYRIHHAGGYNFLDAKVKYKLIKDRLTLFLNATNLMDEDYFRTIYLGDYAKYKQRSALNHRYVMIGAKVNFQ
jgi:hypothetical protein